MTIADSLRFDLIGAGGVGGYWWKDRPPPRPKRRPELDGAIDGQGEAGDGGEASRRAAWIAGWRGVLEAMAKAPKIELNSIDATGAPLTFGEAYRKNRPRLIGRANPRAANRPRATPSRAA